MGAAGAAWEAGLPGLIADLEQRWSITVGRPLSGGSTSYVARVTCTEGSPAVLKIALSSEVLAEQVATLERADGRGYVRLLRSDPARRALLLERLGPSLAASRLEPEEQLAVLAETLREAWLPDDGPPPRRPGQGGVLHQLISETWPRLGRGWPRPVFDQALRYAEGLVGADPVELVVVHGDPHPGNALRLPADRGARPLGTASSTRTGSSPTVRTTWAWPSATGAVGWTGRAPARRWRATARCWPSTLGSIRSGFGAGASWSGCPQGSTC